MRARLGADQKPDSKINIRGALETPVQRKQGGKTKPMPPYEAVL